MRKYLNYRRRLARKQLRRRCRKIGKRWRTLTKRRNRIDRRIRRARIAVDTERSVAWSGRLDLRRSFAQNPIRVALAPQVNAAASRLAPQLGLTPNTPMVVLHVRDSGYYARVDGRDHPHATLRNASIATYLPAIDYLVERGFTIVRIGDSQSVPLRRRGVIDLTTWPHRTSAIDLWCLTNARFFIASDSGPYCLAWLFQVPSLGINFTRPLQNYPLLPHDMAIYKRLRDRRTGRVLSLREMAEHKALCLWQREQAFGHFDYQIFPERRLFDVVDNSSDDIVGAVRDMLEMLDSTEPPARTDEQREFQRLLERVASDCRDPDLFVWNHWAFVASRSGRREYHVGEGRIAPTFASKYFESEDAARMRTQVDEPTRTW
jgi:putative glycosyltransferase (TIGR04372 family)